MAEQADAPDSNPGTERCVGSIPTVGTKKERRMDSISDIAIGRGWLVVRRGLISYVEMGSIPIRPTTSCVAQLDRVLGCDPGGAGSIPVV